MVCYWPDFLPVAQPAVSKYRRKPRALIWPTSLLHPLLNSLTECYCTIYASFPKRYLPEQVKKKTEGVLTLVHMAVKIAVLSFYVSALQLL